MRPIGQQLPLCRGVIDLRGGPAGGAWAHPDFHCAKRLSLAAALIHPSACRCGFPDGILRPARPRARALRPAARAALGLSGVWRRSLESCAQARCNRSRVGVAAAHAHVSGGSAHGIVSGCSRRAVNEALTCRSLGGPTLKPPRCASASGRARTSACGGRSKMPIARSAPSLRSSGSVPKKPRVSALP